MIREIESQPAGGGGGLVEQVAHIFSPKGILSRSPNFEYRPQQQEMAREVALALEQGRHLAVEAGPRGGNGLDLFFPALFSPPPPNKKAPTPTPPSNPH